MLYEYFQKKLLERLSYTPTLSQKKMIGLISQFVFSDVHKKAFLLKGYAGTGKTSTISVFVNLLGEFKYRSVLLAPTGRAAKVLAQYCQRPAYTIHKKIYRQQSTKDGFGKFVLEKNLHKNTLFIVDEGSMISNEPSPKSVFGTGRLLSDLIEYVYAGEGCSLIIIGDTAQLPPVGLVLSQGLAKKQLEMMGLVVTEVVLNEVVRQKEGSGILENATYLRKLLDYENIPLPLKLDTSLPDIRFIGGTDLIEAITNCYDTYGSDDTVVLCRSNKRANKYNQGIRGSILYCEEEITQGDMLMVVKNNYFWLDNEDGGFIANGDLVKLQRIYGYQDLYGFRFADCCLELPDYDLELDAKILLDVISSDSASLSSDQNKEMFYSILEDYAHLKTKKAQYDSVKTNEYFNAIQVKHARAITCHKAQGGQWKAVFVDVGYITPEMADKEFIRWLYTAITRAQEVVYLVNFPKQVFEMDVEF